MKNPPSGLRDVEARDIDFIVSSWTKSYRQSFFATKMSNEVYFTEHKKVIAARFADSRAVIACTGDDIDQILGYIVFQGHVLHYLYVKQPFRRLGIGSALIQDAMGAQTVPIVITHITQGFCKTYKGPFTYNPYLILKGKP